MKRNKERKWSMKNQKKLVSILMALAMVVTAFTTQEAQFNDGEMATVSAAEKASMTKILSLYKNKKYSKVKNMCKKLPQNASEKCVKNMSKKMKKAYLKKVKKYKKYSQAEIGEERILGYFFTDVTNNGKAELIIRHGFDDIATSSCTIYKYVKGKVKKIGTVFTSHTALYAYPNHAGVIGLQTIMGYEAVEKYYEKNSKIKTSYIGNREGLQRIEDYIRLPYLLDDHVPSGTMDVSYKALQ